MKAYRAIATLNRGDRKHIERAFRFMEEIIRVFHSARVPLKNSPPFIVDIVKDMYLHLSSIVSHDVSVVLNNDYLKAFLINFNHKAKDTLKAFRSNGIGNEGSAERKVVIKLSIIFSNMLFELKEYFPDYVYVASAYRISKREAENFWKNHFPGKIYVSWEDFIKAANTMPNGPLDKTEMESFRQTVDIMGHDMVTTFEFDVFTRLFYPWSSILRNWRVITALHPAYAPTLTYDEVRQHLEKCSHMPGSYMYRLSCTRPGQWAIGYVGQDHKIYQTIPQNKSLIIAVHEGNRDGFYKYPKGKRIANIDLGSLLEICPAERIKVPADEYDAYCEMGSSYEMCKICDDRNKNVRVEPCGHLLCSVCLANWQEAENGNTCPFCREEIKTTSLIMFVRETSSNFEEIPNDPVETAICEEMDDTIEMNSHNGSAPDLIDMTENGLPLDIPIPPRLPESGPPPLPPRTHRRNRQ
ncbi:unnamed protein product [Auanema sp. JU1783]|nr:unnamed protein product [Auanema sp. JU1783]